jgi:hypothetical protein
MTEVPEIKRAGLYARVSREEQAEGQLIALKVGFDELESPRSD